jgi:D-aminoacyl-tRNA deacylase
LAGTVTVDGREIGRCGQGLVLLVGVHKDDTKENAEKLAIKIANVRIFNDHEGKMNLSLLDFPMNGLPDAPLEYDVLAVSNFTVYSDANKSRRPSFTDSAKFEIAEALFNHFVDHLRRQRVDVQTGRFGADMRVSIVNDGPVTIILDV